MRTGSRLDKAKVSTPSVHIPEQIDRVRRSPQSLQPRCLATHLPSHKQFLSAPHLTDASK